MAVRAVSSPPVSFLQCRLCHSQTYHFRPCSQLGFPFPISRYDRPFIALGAVPRCSVQSLVNSVLKELEALRERREIRATSKVQLTTREEIVEDKLRNQTLQKGLLLEFQKDSDRILLAVAQRLDGKKNWVVSDQVLVETTKAAVESVENGIKSSIKPQQITFVVPGVGDFDHADIQDFIKKAQDKLDPTLLELAWVELLEENKSVTAEELAEMIFGNAEPLESYCAHLLLSKDEIYFTVLETKGSHSIYGPRPTVQVEELIQRKLTKEAAEKELYKFVELLKSAKEMPTGAKPSKLSWMNEEKIRGKIKSLESYAIDTCKSDDEKKTAGAILKAMGLAKMSSSALNLLIDIGYFPVHVNLDLLKLNIRTDDYPDEVLSVAESLLSESFYSDKVDRKDLTHLKVYAIDVDEADELDDALSATKLPDGRIKVWIHVADPCRFVHPGSTVDREALKRGTSIFLPTATYPMFPEKLAMEGMSLKQGKVCNAVTVSVMLHSDGSIAEYSVDNSIIKPTYMLTYESATELLDLNLAEEAELKYLSEAATLRLQWRRQQGAIDTATLEARIKVANPEGPKPVISLFVENQADPAMRLVCEMMLLCGEVVATYGSRNNIPLPYRGQPQSDINTSEFSHLPEGPVRSAAIVKLLRAAEMDFRKPIRHGVLGLPGYVQFTSPIRRYMDLLAHYQIKAFLRGESPPFSAGQLEGMASIVNMNARLARKLSSSSLRYWIIEFLRRQPKERKLRALVLRFIRDRNASLFLVEVGLQASAWVSAAQVGDEVNVQIEKAHPRDDVLYLKEVVV